MTARERKPDPPPPTRPGKTPGSQVYKLTEPVPMGSETVTELEFRKPTGKDLRGMAGDPTGYTLGTFLDFASDLTGEPPAVFDALCLEDTMAVVAIAGGFIASGRPTGRRR